MSSIFFIQTFAAKFVLIEAIVLITVRVTRETDCESIVTIFAAQQLPASLLLLDTIMQTFLCEC